MQNALGDGDRDVGLEVLAAQRIDLEDVRPQLRLRPCGEIYGAQSAQPKQIPVQITCPAYGELLYPAVTLAKGRHQFGQFRQALERHLLASGVEVHHRLVAVDESVEPLEPHRLAGW